MGKDKTNAFVYKYRKDGVDILGRAWYIEYERYRRYRFSVEHDMTFGDL